MIVDHLQAQLAALGEVDVLRPEQALVTLDGRRPGQAGGLSGYAHARPNGFVQIEAPLPISSDGLLDLFWLPVACVAPTEAAANTLAALVRRQLVGTPRDPGHYGLATPDVARQVADDVWLCRPTFSLSLLAGFVPE